MLTLANHVEQAKLAYDNSNYAGYKEFQADLRRAKNVDRCISQFRESGKININLVCNHITILKNVFGVDFAVRLLFFSCDQTNQTYMKSFLLAMGYIQENQRIPEIDLANVACNNPILELVKPHVKNYRETI